MITAVNDNVDMDQAREFHSPISTYIGRLIGNIPLEIAQLAHELNGKRISIREAMKLIMNVSGPNRVIRINPNEKSICLRLKSGNYFPFIKFR